MRRALGKGLSQLLGETVDAPTTEVAVSSIVPNARQPRRHFDQDALEELAASIRQVGILQPLIVRPISGGKYELIAGERRLRAAQIARLPTVPVVVRSADLLGSLEIALIENIQREDISPLECAEAYRRLIDEFDLTQEEVAAKVGKSRPAVANTVRLLKLPERIRSGLAEGKISEGHARALLGVESPEIQLALYDRIVKRGLTVRDVEAAAKGPLPKRRPGSKQTKDAPRSTDPAWRALEDGLSMYFGSTVRLERGPVGGKIVIDFYSDDDLDRMLELLGIHL
jgi:ParB family chromosome partitioning protein